MLPGTGSDEVFVRSVFEDPLSEAGVALVAPAKHDTGVFDDAWEQHHQPIVAGGISLGAHLAAVWAVRNPERCAGLVLALPAWSGDPDGAPAALAAAASADAVESVGIEAALQGVSGWLAVELDRAWRRHGDGLVPALRSASRSVAPTLAQLRALPVPAGIAACTDDPVHPLEVALEWAAALPYAALHTTTLTALGEDRSSLGRAAVRAWLRAC